MKAAADIKIPRDRDNNKMLNVVAFLLASSALMPGFRKMDQLVWAL